MALTTLPGHPQAPARAEMVHLNGSDIYYEVYGSGTPLFLLHGYTWSSKFWHPYVPGFLGDFAVYLVDLKGHGRSGPFTGQLSIQAAAEDLSALISYLKLDSILAIGYSYGGDVMFQLELRNPGLVKRMMAVGTCGSWDATDFPEWIEMLSYRNIEGLTWIREQHQSEAQVKALLDQIPNYKVHLSNADLAAIRSPTLFVVGDRDDGTSVECLLHARQHMPESYLWMVPNTGHRAHTGSNMADFIRVARTFLKPDADAGGAYTPSAAGEACMAVMRKAVQAVNDRDFEALKQYLAPGFVRHDLTSAFPGSETGSAAAINFLEALMAGIPDVAFEVQDMASDGERAFVRFRFIGTHKGTLMGHPATGKQVDFSGINIYRFEGGQIAEVWQVWDWAGVLQQIGAIDGKR